MRLAAHWQGPGQSAVQVRQWRVQSEDGSILCFGQDQEFRRNLPYGSYQVELKAQPNAGSSELSVKGTLVVNSREVRLGQRILAKR